MVAHARPRFRRLTLSTVFVGIARELRLLAPVYVARRPAALSAHSTLRSLLHELTQKDDPSSKAETICTVLVAHQTTPHRLWVAILLRTFRPMIRHVFKKLCGGDREERLALLLASFQEAIRRVDPVRDPVRIAMYVRQTTRRGVFAALGVQRDWEQVGFGEDADETPDARGDAQVTASEVLRGIPDLELLRTRTEHGALWELVQRQVAGSEEEKLREYDRLRRRRKQLEMMLRNHELVAQEAR